MSNTELVGYNIIETRENIEFGIMFWTFFLIMCINTVLGVFYCIRPKVKRSNEIRWKLREDELKEDKLKDIPVLLPYSEKSFVLRGNTKMYKEKIKELGGRWNKYLKGGSGWIFSNSKRKIVNEWLMTLE